MASRAGAQPAAHGVAVTERDFHISAPSTLPAGNVRLHVDNQGPDQHELLVARVGGNATLPLRRDGLTVDEERIQAAEVGTLEPGAPGARRELNLRLSPGRYVLFCNMSGHYLGGMHADLVVR
ncbi:MAG TPA: hypothetical protein VF032_21700 [Thermoleophilaceae bacterium]